MLLDEQESTESSEEEDTSLSSDEQYQYHAQYSSLDVIQFANEQQYQYDAQYSGEDVIQFVNEQYQYEVQYSGEDVVQFANERDSSRSPDGQYDTGSSEEQASAQSADEQEDENSSDEQASAQSARSTRWLVSRLLVLPLEVISMLTSIFTYTNSKQHTRVDSKYLRISWSTAFTNQVGQSKFMLNFAQVSGDEYTKFILSVMSAENFSHFLNFLFSSAVPLQCWGIHHIQN